MSHGAGGKASRRLVEGLIAPLLANPVLAKLSDAAAFALDGTRVATTADGYVVRPLRFPGGSIGELAVNGTVNDLAVSGARAHALMATLILEAGLPTATLAGGGRGDGARRGACRRRDRRRRHEGRRARTVRRHVRHDVRDRRRRRAVDARCALGAARRPGAAQRTGRRPWDHDPARARRVATRSATSAPTRARCGRSSRR